MRVAYTLTDEGISISTKYVNAEATVVKRVMTQAVLIRFFLPLAAMNMVLVPSACVSIRLAASKAIISLIINMDHSSLSV